MANRFSHYGGTKTRRVLRNWSQISGWAGANVALVVTSDERGFVADVDLVVEGPAGLPIAAPFLEVPPRPGR